MATSPARSWTVMVYLCGDNDLDSLGAADSYAIRIDDPPGDFLDDIESKRPIGAAQRAAGRGWSDFLTPHLSL
jgi:hypothetical protein